MMEAIIVAIITGLFTLVGIVINSRSSRKELTAQFQADLKVHQAVTDTKIEELTREVREHNNFAKRMPVCENDIKNLYHKLNDLERKMEA